MKKSAELKQELQRRLQAQSKIVETAKTESRSLNDEEAQRFDAEQAEIDKLKTQITRAEQFEENQRMSAAASGIPVNPELGDGESKEKRKMRKRFSMVRAIRNAKPGASQDGVEGEIHQMGIEEASRSGLTLDENTGFALPSYMMRADAQTVTQDSGEFGGALVQDNDIVMSESFMPRLWVEEMGATVMRGLSGGDVPIVTGENYELEWLDEDEANTSTKGKFTPLKLSPKRASRTVGISNRLLAQSSIDVDGFITRKLGQGASRAFERAFINGTTAAKSPNGILNTTGVLTAADASAADIDWGRIIELQGLIESNDATERSLGYLMDPLLAAKMKTEKKDAGSGRFLLEGDNLAGYKYRSTNLVPTLSGQHVLIYGDFAQLYIGMWAGASFVVDPYSQAGKDNVAVHVNVYGDCGIAQPKAFAVNKFLNA